MSARTPPLITLLSLLCLGLGACASRPPARPAPASRRPEATMIVPSEDNRLAQRIRQNLAERGWTLIPYTPALLEADQNYRAMARQARYRLTLSATRIGACRNGEPSFLYNLAIIENRSGDVPLALSGASCLSPAVQHFAADLDAKQIVPPFSQPSLQTTPEDKARTARRNTR